MKTLPIGLGARDAPACHFHIPRPRLESADTVGGPLELDVPRGIFEYSILSRAPTGACIDNVLRST